MTFEVGGGDVRLVAVRPAPVSEADLDEAFEASPEFGIQYLDSEFREWVLRHIKRVGRGFFDTHGDDLLDVYQETALGMLERARKPGFEPCRSLRMVLAIARNKAIDLLRQRGHRINLDEDAILDVVAADTKGSDILLQWRRQPVLEINLEDNTERTLGECEVVQIKPGHAFCKKVKYKRG